jgi:DNA-binding MarR family transcriptional regulator
MDQRPFGYWIKQIDRGIEETLGRILSDEDLSRRSWQVFNTVAEGPITPADLDRALAPFLSAEEPTMRPYADELTRRGWVTSGGRGALGLTDEGQRAHRRVSERVRAMRARITDGLSPQEYATMVQLLRRVAANLEV